jgi:lysozyme
MELKLRLTDDGLAHLKQFEGCRLKSYRDSVGVATIGYGQTGGVTLGMTITQEQADFMLLSYLVKQEEYMEKLLSDVELTDNQWDALVLFSYSIGLGNFKKSELFKKVLKDPNDPTIYQEFGRWTKARGQNLVSLVRRRAWEAARYTGAV